MVEAYREFWQNYTNIKGRTSRKVFWQTMAINMIILLLFFSLVFLGLIVFDNYLLAGIGYMSYILFGLAILCPQIMMAIRRLNDSGKEWFYIFLPFIPIIGGIWLFILLVQPSKKRTKRRKRNEF